MTMEIVNTETLTVTTLAKLRKQITTNVPDNPAPEQLAKLDHAPLEVEPAPTGDKVTRLGKAELRDGKYYPTFQVEAFSPDELLEQAKRDRIEDVAAITVTTASGLTFDGDEDSQTRMARALLGMTDADTIDWVLADNSITTVGKAELAEALRLAGLEQARLWVLPYTTQP
ncbi:DUF4376 domain-containing protein [Marinobacterium sedimentorum]|uniref:DUF4376 domain-containing protein n=1 Tax=Marinobacterium sedimentorum TaxID=2927804 RepID=UPI0020C5C549|nr:hypothetical protein [Marinobacterium sedimentorum]MCP8687749.1 hypothetical protein [Marinobacterium sedimentorum]